MVGVGPSRKNHSVPFQVLASFAKPMPVKFLDKGFHEDLGNQPYATKAAPETIPFKDFILMFRRISIGIP